MVKKPKNGDDAESAQMADADAAAENEELMFRSSDDIRSSYISGIQAFQVKPVEYSVIDDLAFFEGDILLGTAQEL
jgi:hypothetical protein